MKMFKYKFSFLAIVLAIIFVGCNSKDTEKENVSTLETPYMRMKINGKLWEGNDYKSYKDYERIPFYIKEIWRKDSVNQLVPYVLYIEGTIPTEKTDDAVKKFSRMQLIMPFIEGLPKIGVDYTYTISDESAGLAVLHDHHMIYHTFDMAKATDNSIEEYEGYFSYRFVDIKDYKGKLFDEESYPYTVRFTEIKKSEDPIYNYIVSGVFSGKLKNWETGEIIEITEGEFKSKM